MCTGFAYQKESAVACDEKGFSGRNHCRRNKRELTHLCRFFLLSQYIVNFQKARIFAYRSRAIRAILSLTVYYTPL